MELLQKPIIRRMRLLLCRLPIGLALHLAHASLRIVDVLCGCRRVRAGSSAHDAREQSGSTGPDQEGASLSP